MSGSRHDLADEWLSIFELLPSKDGLKLRVPIPETAIIKDARILGWFYTSREGFVSRAAAHEVTSDSLLSRLLSQQVIDVVKNPFTYVAVAHYESGIARLLRRPELQSMLLRIAGPYEPPAQPGSDEVELPFCLQQYVPPSKDLRYIATFAGTEFATCTTFARKYSSRYTHPFDDPADVAGSRPSIAHNNNNNFSDGGVAAEGGGADGGRPTSGISVASDNDREGRALSSEEMLVESQLVALGLLDARDMSAGGTASGGTGGSGGQYGGTGGRGSVASVVPPQPPADAIAPASKQVKLEVSRAVQNMMSYIERAHGWRIQGIVAEFIKTYNGSILLTGVHATQLDARSSRGRLGTFTERWADFLMGMGPTPAPRASTRVHGSPSLLRTNNHPGSSGGSSGGGGGGGGELGRGGAGLSMTDRSGRGPSYSNGGGGGGGNCFAVGRNSGASVSSSSVLLPGQSGGLRPASAPPQNLQMFSLNRHNGAPATTATNGHYTLRNAVSASRRGAGGNPTAAPPQADSYPLWTPRDDGLAGESVVSALALELETAKDRLQYQTDVAARAEAALQQLAASSQAVQVTMAENLSAVRVDLEAVIRLKREVEQEAAELRAERAGMAQQLAAAEEEAVRLRRELDRDRETLANSLRSGQIKEENMDTEMMRLREENEELSRRLGHASRRLDEEQEVVEAVRAQLYDYKAMVQTMQAQMRRGKGGAAGAAAAAAAGGGKPLGVNMNASIKSLLDGGTYDDAENSGDLSAAAKGGTQGGSNTLNSKSLAAHSAAAAGGGGRTSGSNGGNSKGGWGGAAAGWRPSSGGANPSNSERTEAPPEPRPETPDMPEEEPGCSGGGAGGGRSGRLSRASSGASSPALPPVRPSSAATTSCPASPKASCPTRPASAALSATGGGASRPASPKTSCPASPKPPGPARPASAALSAAGGGPPPASPSPATVTFKNVPSNAGSDHPGEALAEMRKQRRLDLLHSDPTLLDNSMTVGDPSRGGIVVLHNDAAAAAGISGIAEAAAADAGGEEKTKIKYESLRIVDLIHPAKTVSLTPRQIEMVANIGRMLQEHEKELKDIFAFYGALQTVVVVDSRVCMTETQFVKFARETGVAEDTVYPEVLEAIFHEVADKREEGGRYGMGNPRLDHFQFDVFPEAICRLAAAKFEWRPSADGLDETQSMLAEEELMQRHSLVRGNSPKSRSQSALALGRPGSALGDPMGSGTHPPSEGEPEVDMTDYNNGEAPPEVVLYTLVKAYLYINVLPCARRYKTSGTRLAKERVKLRSAPSATWKQ